jgi:hypothetical protein
MEAGHETDFFGFADENKHRHVRIERKERKE